MNPSNARPKAMASVTFEMTLEYGGDWPPNTTMAQILKEGEAQAVQFFNDIRKDRADLWLSNKPVVRLLGLELGGS